jgi:type IX secretion system substrate protein
MQFKTIVIISGLMFSFVFGSEGIQFKNISNNYVILKANPKNMNTRVSAPVILNNNKESMATFDVDYNGFSSQAQTAFQHAVNIWSSILTSPVSIKVIANWDSLGTNVLGSASAATFLRSDSLPKINTWYPISLAESFLPSSYNHADSADIVANFNSNFSQWYFGTDGNCPQGRYDFVTVVLHELCHGLGFQGSMDISSGQGSWGYGSGFPFIYDHYTEDSDGQSLLNSSVYPSPGLALANILTNSAVYFNGAASNSANGFSPVRLFAPSTWEVSSSYSHLNETTYPAGNINSLMTPTLGASEVIHHPGNVTLGIFEDIGWTTNLVLNRKSVYPGDTDNNGIVNAADILPIGIHFLAQGGQRQQVSFTWGAKEAIVWNDSAATFADSNGDGIVDEKDVIGIGVNWGKTHTGIITKPIVDYNDPELLMPYRDNFEMIYNSLSGQGSEVMEIKHLLNSIFKFEDNFPGFFSLDQNYPNPFNPATNIKFNLPEEQKVSMSVFNTVGQMVAEIIKNKSYDSGIHNIKFNASALANGIYIYTIKTENFNQSRKMIVLK